MTPYRKFKEFVHTEIILDNPNDKHYFEMGIKAAVDVLRNNQTNVIASNKLAKKILEHFGLVHKE